MKKICLLGLVLFGFSPLVQAAPTDGSCVTTRGILDIGSGATKMKIARVDHCLQKIIEFLPVDGQTDEDIKVSYADDLKEQKKLTGEQNFSPKIQAEGLAAIQTLMQKGNAKNQVEEWAGFATSAFRNAKNGASVLKSFADQLHIKLSLINQDEEGLIGYIAGIQFVDAKIGASAADLSHVIVWDIGGSSQQFSYRDESGVLHVVKLEQKASVTFKEAVLRDVKNIQDPSVKSPNPIGRENIAAALVKAQAYAATVNFPFQPSQVIGIGGVHAKSIMGAIGERPSYRRRQLRRAEKSYAQMTDAQINNAFADTYATNLILVHGMMEKLGWRKITVSPYSSTDGALVDQNIWSTK
jgi:exopolyphosphatase/guanosine-5'-triphosphate,3'-diphosphate pyrophosphatase